MNEKVQELLKCIKAGDAKKWAKANKVDYELIRNIDEDNQLAQILSQILDGDTGVQFPLSDFDKRKLKVLDDLKMISEYTKRVTSKYYNDIKIKSNIVNFIKDAEPTADPAVYLSTLGSDELRKTFKTVYKENRSKAKETFIAQWKEANNGKMPSRGELRKAMKQWTSENKIQSKELKQWAEDLDDQDIQTRKDN